MRARVGETMRPTPYRYVLRTSGISRFSLNLRTAGVLEEVEVAGLGQGETSTSGGRASSSPWSSNHSRRAPREVSFLVKPVGAPVHLEGARDGRPLRAQDVTTAGDRHPDGFPFLLPDPERENPPAEAQKLFRSPEGEADGLGVWLVESSPGTTPEVDDETLEALRALGYVEE